MMTCSKLRWMNHQFTPVELWKWLVKTDEVDEIKILYKRIGVDESKILYKRIEIGQVYCWCCKSYGVTSLCTDV